MVLKNGIQESLCWLQKRWQAVLKNKKYFKMEAMAKNITLIK